MYDLIIRNGLIVDGTGQKAYPADLGVKADRIAAIGDLASEQAAQVFDANGFYVTPGLIDPHVHEEMIPLTDGTFEFFLKQGVTTVVNGNCGHSVVPGPVKNILDYYYGNGLINDTQRDSYLARYQPWDDFSGYARAVKKSGSNLNFVTLMGHGTIRWSVMGGADQRQPTEQEWAEIEAIVRHNMEQGMFGISFGLDYVPSRYADIDELCRVVEWIKSYDGVSAAHLRHSIGILESTLEFLEVGRRTGAKVQLSHLASSVPEAFTAAQKAIEEDGVRARIDTIPDSLGHCTSKKRMLQFIMALSDDLFDQGVEGVKRALHTPEGRKIVLQDAYIFGGDKHAIYIVLSEDASLENRSVADIAAERGVDPDACMLDLLGDDNDCVFWLNAPAANVPSKFIDHVPEIVGNPYVSVGSDEIMGDVEDPFDWYELRRRGSFAIFCQRYLAKGVPFEEIVRRNTTLVAEFFGITERGKLVEGNYADLAVIDAENFRYPEASQEHYKTPLLTAQGCHLTVVNGQIALCRDEVLRPFAGRVLKRND